ncbi:hypothetical protein NOF55_00160 [Rhizobiaceae bacterium BDR2-2]|uniref:Uncharacterized protein n=1 Tax=Ectorhizobium quercum TaxID=2965071 RepID=A0AAE3MWB3_9HYPH|nr:hypothetical protein [Ectorhizobium quercum]MCX8995517.1 hypothetical protein [Ectorhizobium quercum]
MPKKIRYFDIQVAKIDRQKYAVVPLHEYEAFVRENRLRKAQRRPRPTKINANPEIAAFLASVLGTMPVDEIFFQCRIRFGEENAPSVKRIYAHWARLRRQAALNDEQAMTNRALFGGAFGPHASAVDKNPALAEFLATTLGTKHIDDVIAECQARFGAENVPSKSAIYRHWTKLRQRPTRTVTMENEHE